MIAVTDQLRIALAQLNPKVGDLPGNLALARQALAGAQAAKADILMLSELFLTGYFPDDLLFKPQFVADAMETARSLVADTAGTDVVLILPTIWQDKGNLYNAVVVGENGEIIATRYKRELPNTDVFYEKRYFAAGPLPQPVEIKGVPVGIPICEDIWHRPVCEHLAMRGAEIMLCPNGSPYWTDKQHIRKDLVRARVAEDGVPLIYLNQVGGQDELIYDGASFAIEPGEKLVIQGKSFESDFIVSDWARGADGWTCTNGRVDDLTSVKEAPWRAAVLGLRDYVQKNGFRDVVLGLSGGIDSAVVAAMAVDAFGPEKVHCIMLPYRYTSEDSLRDAKDCASRLGVRYDIVAIGVPVDDALRELQPIFGNRPLDTAEENIQSRMRGTILMAVSNKLGSMLLTTGNKSEMGVGYATIYGDMNGGYNPLKDMFKMEVYALADWRNKHLPGDCLGPSGEVIPQSIIDKAPSAELRPDQTDQDSLPPYPVLDDILRSIVEDEMSLGEVVARGHDPALVKRIERLLNIAEYKRRQSAPGPKLTPRAFGLGRKYPITNGYKDFTVG
ncbi:NAD+ synthase [Devosia sp. 63-57]|uniref:NAD+ synthase n=1 Tax=Devosia sp. 63-57 TaxID=1895751 RepID=UPI00086DB5B2|nr:NAD+ synthase [Devosia sp. 63-57]ODT47338.1 MAG: NAD+ synthase [Pelagibacterium sp. SCN 63-126]ODU87015.1 MAG: NAD+ synthase [Pelagibacterium sp. SCN 63-17]OJX42954.1 MAG: NAD+ synthase [Devosia sp. 63-57]